MYCKASTKEGTMTKKNFSRVTSLLLTVAAVFCMVCFNPGEADAAGRYQLAMNDVVWIGEDPSISIYDVKAKEGSSEVKIYSVKSSDSSVAAPVKQTYKDIDGKTHKFYIMKTKKPGVVKITISYRTVKGKKASMKKKVSVKAYPNEIRSLRVNGKKINLNKAGNRYFISRKCKTTKPRVKLKVAKGWKLDYLRAYAYGNSGEKKVKLTKKMLRSGKTIKFQKRYKNLFIDLSFRNADGDLIYYTVNLYR